MSDTKKLNAQISRRSFVGLGAAASAAAVVAAPFVASAEEAAPAGGLTPGTYEVQAIGFQGPMTLAVTFDEKGITAIDILNSRETVNVGTKGLEVMAARAVEAQSFNVDGVAGATFSAFAFRDAVSKAIEMAGGDPADFSAEVHYDYDGPAAEDVETTVVIAGAGAAGMLTAVQLARRGVPVIVVEKRELLGGTSSRAGYQLVGVGSRTQRESDEVPYKTPDDMYAQVEMQDPKGLIDRDLVRDWCDNMWRVMDWITFDMGVPLHHVEPAGIATVLSAEDRAAGLVWGGMYTEALGKELARLGVDVRNRTRAVDLVVEDGRAVGLVVESPNGSYTTRAKAVVIATGAFGSNPDMIAEYLPDWVGFPSNEVPEATGDGILMAQKAGAALSGMDEDHIMLYTACVKMTPTESVPLIVRAAGGMIVNMEGKRFHNELDVPLNNLAFDAKQQTEGRYFAIVDQTFVDATGPIRTAVSGETLEEVAEQLGIDPAGLVEQTALWNEMREAGEDTQFGRPAMPFGITQPPFWGVELFTALHGFDGGIDVDRGMHVLREDGSVFEGLYAEGGGVDFKFPGYVMTSKAFTAQILADTLLAELGYEDPA